MPSTCGKRKELLAAADLERRAMVQIKLEDSVLLPALAGISSVLLVIALLFWLQSSRLYHTTFRQGGTHIEIDESGARVRRSARSILNT